jgi:hypothetical protein
LPSAERIAVDARRVGEGYVAEVTVRDGARTTHRVRVSADELARYGGGDVADLVRRSFEFLLERETSTQILREFDLSTIERYFPEYARAIARR